MTTIKQVAEEAGVSKSTVSRYIAQNGYVGKESQERVEKAIKKLGFVPNLSARTLKTKTSTLVGLLLPDISNPFFPMLAKGVGEYLKKRGYQVLLGNVGENAEVEEDYLTLLCQSNAAGVITTNDFTDKFSDIGIPVVVVDRVGHRSPYGVFANNEEGGRIAAQVIAGTGARQVAVISGPVTSESINNRFKASTKYLSGQKINYIEFYSSAYDFSIIQSEAKKILDDYPEVDSIIAPSDIHAIGFIHEILNRRKKVPEDIQVIGYDDVLLSRFTYPALSTIHQPAYEMGVEAARLVYKLATGQPIDETRIELPVYYVERETVRKGR